MAMLVVSVRMDVVDTMRLLDASQEEVVWLRSCDERLLITKSEFSAATAMVHSPEFNASTSMAHPIPTPAIVPAVGAT